MVDPQLFAKHPDGLLARIFSPAKSKLLQSTQLNLERDAELFSYILDFYRTGTFDPDPSLAKGRLEEESKFYGVYEKMFPMFKKQPAAGKGKKREKKANSPEKKAASPEKDKKASPRGEAKKKKSPSSSPRSPPPSPPPAPPLQSPHS